VTLVDDPLRRSARYTLHRRYLVPVTAIELDDEVWARVRRWFPADADERTDRTSLTDGYQGTTYPVVERGDDLVLVAGFASFAALRDAGAAWATAYVLEAADERELLELAGVLAMGRGP
jgi:hypothetical protein